MMTMRQIVSGDDGEDGEDEGQDQDMIEEGQCVRSNQFHAPPPKARAKGQSKR